MMGHHEKHRSGDEVDTFSRWRKVTIHRPGKFRKVKSRANRRYRRLARELVRDWWREPYLVPVITEKGLREIPLIWEGV